MSRPPAVPVEDKQRIVLSVLSGETTLAEAARRNKVSEQSVSLEEPVPGDGADRAGRVASRARRRAEQQLQAEIDELTTALGEAHVQLRVWNRSAESQLGLRGP